MDVGGALFTVLVMAGIVALGCALYAAAERLGWCDDPTYEDPPGARNDSSTTKGEPT